MISIQVGDCWLWNLIFYIQRCYCSAVFIPNFYYALIPVGGPLDPAPSCWDKCTVKLGYKHGLKITFLNLKDHAPQPTISHLETDHNKSTAAALARLFSKPWTQKISIFTFMLGGQHKPSRNSVSLWLLPLSTCLHDSGQYVSFPTLIVHLLEQIL